MTIQTLSEDIFRELGSPASLSVPAVAYWARNHIGSLNSLLRTNFVLASDSLNVVPEIAEEEKVVLQKLFNIYYYDTQIRASLGAAGIDTVLEVTSDGATVRTASRNEIAKTWVQFKKTEQEDLAQLVAFYLAANVAPLQVLPTAVPVSGERVFIPKTRYYGNY